MIAKKGVKWLVVGVVLLLLAATNPSKSDYLTWAEDQVTGGTQSTIAQGLIKLIGGPVIDSATDVTDLFLVSIYRTHVFGTEIITIGVFRHFIPIKRLL